MWQFTVAELKRSVGRAAKCLCLAEVVNLFTTVAVSLHSYKLLTLLCNNYNSAISRKNIHRQPACLNA
jgi:hypothetical protein